MPDFHDPTPEQMRDFVTWLKDHHHVTVTHKADAAEMELIGDWLEGVGILDAEAFMARFATTIGSVVYVPWEPGEGNTWHQLSTLTHELQHVHQHRRDGYKYLIGYLGSAAKRAHYEADAYATSLELHFTRYGSIPSHAPKVLGQKLDSYGVSNTDIEVAIRELTTAARSLDGGPYRSSLPKFRWATDEVVKWTRSVDLRIVGRFD